MNTTRRTLVFYLFGIMISYFMLETMSFMALHSLKILRPHHFVHGFVDSHFDSITDQFRERFIENAYDRILGWDNQPLKERHLLNSINREYTVSHDVDGSRSDGLPQKELLINTYGDSMTWCDEVGNHETWQYFLESRIGYDVKNFGVAAYGTGQAVLKLERHITQGLTAPVTILGIYEDNVHRTVTSFHPFYARRTLVKLGFQPAFRLASSGQVEMIPNPYDSEALLLQDLRLLAHQIVEQDFWILKRRKLIIRYPYIFQLIRTTRFFAGRKLRVWSGKSPNHIDDVNLWETAEGSAIMHHLVDRFVKLTTESHSLPIILFFPPGKTLSDSEVPQYTQFRNEIEERHADLIVIDIVDHEFDKERFHVRPYKGHASVYGNEVIAHVIYQIYENITNERKLAPASSQLDN